MDLLTDGAIEMMRVKTAEQFKPVVQIIDLKLVNPQGGERYRVVLSDGRSSQQGMLLTQNHNLIHQGKVKKGTLVKLVQYTVNYIKTKM